MAVDWSYYNKFEGLVDRYMPISGEGETKASQIVTAVNKLIYKWYNDGDVFDNTHHLEGWANDLSSYANWLWEHTDAHNILDKIAYCFHDGNYEDLLKELADKLLNEKYLVKQNELEKVGTIYKCDGKFKFVEYEEDEDDWDYEEEEEEEC
jgi:hypothetical protein